MSRYSEIQEKNSIKKQKDNETEENNDHYADVTNDDDYDEDDMKLMELKQRLELQVKPKSEVEESDRCRSCSNLAACVDIFEQKDGEEFDVAYKLKLIGGIAVRHLKSSLSIINRNNENIVVLIALYLY